MYRQMNKFISFRGCSFTEQPNRWISTTPC